MSKYAKAAALLCALAATAAVGQDEPPAQAQSLPPVYVTALRAEQLAQKAPVSVTALTARDIEQGGVTSVKQAAAYAPNVILNEFSDRATSNPEVRGIGGSPTNPAVTTYIDGVPQLNGDTSSIELIDIGQIEFVRGAQGGLYGRNTLGGLISIRSRAPEMDAARASASQGFGDYLLRDTRLSLSGPLVGDVLAGSLAAGRAVRDGYSVNQATGHSADSRDAVFGKAQLLWLPDADWRVRLIAVAESAHDGDFSLTDYAQLRAQPRVIDHDYEGRTERRITGQTLNLDYQAHGLRLASTTGYYRYTAFETTDLDTSASDDLTRNNGRHGTQLTQELRVESADPLTFSWSKELSLDWQAGLFGFHQTNDQGVTNFIALKYLLANAGSFFPTPVPLPTLPELPLGALPGAQDRTTAQLQGSGAGAYGQLTFDYASRWQLALGLRYDRENQHADTSSGTVLPLLGTDVPLGSPSTVQQGKGDDALSPRGSLSYQLDQQTLLYGSVTRGFRAGGYNAVAPDGKAAYGEEHSSSYEIGAKGRWLDARLSASLSAFLIDLKNLQLNIPDPGTPGRFYIDNAGNSRNRGLELELAAKPLASLELFAAAGLLDARFGGGSADLGTDASGHRVPFASPLSFSGGAEQIWSVGAAQLSLRAEYQRAGDYFYTAANDVRQSAVDLVNLRAAVAGERWRIEAWTRNLLNRDYIPLAIPYTGITPSGYVGESAPPRSFGLNLSFQV